MLNLPPRETRREIHIAILIWHEKNIYGNDTSIISIRSTKALTFCLTFFIFVSFVHSFYVFYPHRPTNHSLTIPPKPTSLSHQKTDVFHSINLMPRIIFPHNTNTVVVSAYVYIYCKNNASNGMKLIRYSNFLFTCRLAMKFQYTQVRN